MEKTNMKTVTLATALVFLFFLMTITANAMSIRVLSLDNISYIDSDAVEHTCSDYTILTSSMTSLSAGWYVVNDDLEFSSKITLTGNVNLILCNGKTMEITGYNGLNNIGIDGGSSYDLTVYGQTLDDKTAGRLKVEVTGSSHYGINVKKYTQHSGTVFLKSNYSHGLYTSSTVTINGGTLDVKASSSSTAIYASSSITINGGKVIAQGNKGIYCNSSFSSRYITLGWTNNTDMIRASSIEHKKGASYIRIADNQTITDGTNTYNGTLTSDVLSAIAGKTLAPAWLGSGTETEPWQIQGRGHLDLLANSVNNGNSHSGDYFKVMNDIFYPYSSFSNEENYVGIGEAWSASSNSFQGHFDGDNHTISGVRIYQPWANRPCQGLFRSIEEGAEVKNIILEDTRITGYANVGGIVGYCRNGTVTNCRVKSDVTIRYQYSDPEYLGGVVGINMYGTIDNCISSAVISRSQNNDNFGFYGGIAGYSEGTLTNCLAIGATVPLVNNNNENKAFGAITCISTTSSSNVLSNNYYVNCTVAGINNATGVGCGHFDPIYYECSVSDIATNHGAVHALGRTVEGYEDSEDSDHWVFISSPLAANVAPTAVFGLMADPAEDYDFYELVNTTWANYKDHEGNIDPGFSMVNGQGYLYACKNTTTLAFIGAYNTGSTMNFNLNKGWNLVGNPFSDMAFINRPFYKMNAEGTGIEAVSEYWNHQIAVCTGVVVNAENAGNVTFSKTAPDHATTNNAHIQLSLAKTIATRSGSSTNSTVDKAIVSFNEDSRLEKFYFGEQDANIYIPQNGKEYAIAYSEMQGEMPLNFMARKDGEYTLTISAPLNSQISPLTYLHLIDNLTGNDVDLLVNPIYSFYACTTDYASRFRLVFSPNDNENEDFAFISDGNIIVNGTGTLQVIDLLGRQLYSHESNSAFRIPHSEFPAGVYVLRLINGDKMRTQKIVIR